MIDPEWQGLMDDWQEAEPGPAPLPAKEVERIRRQARRRSYGLILLGLGEVFGSLALVAWLFQDLPERHGPVEIVALVAILFFLAVAFAFTFWNRRGVWWPAAESTRTFVEFSAERCRRKLRALRFCPWLLAAELAFLVPWSIWALLARAAPLDHWWAAFGWMALSVVVVFWGGAWYRRRTLRELAGWEELLGSLADET